MARTNKAVVNDATGLVENIIVVDGPFDLGPGKTLMDPEGAETGGRWNGEKFTPAPAPPPDENAVLDAAIDGAATLDALKSVLAGRVAVR